MEKIAKLDQWLIERLVEPAAWWLSRWVSPFYVARFFAIAFLAAILAAAVADRDMVSVSIAVLALSCVPWRMWLISRLEDSVIRRGLPNQERHTLHDVCIRVFLVLVNVASVVLAFITWELSKLTVGNLAWLLHLYFSTCNRPPPQPQAYTRMATQGNNG